MPIQYVLSLDPDIIQTVARPSASHASQPSAEPCARVCESMCRQLRLRARNARRGWPCTPRPKQHCDSSAYPSALPRAAPSSVRRPFGGKSVRPMFRFVPALRLHSRDSIPCGRARPGTCSPAAPSAHASHPKLEPPRPGENLGNTNRHEEQGTYDSVLFRRREAGPTMDTQLT